MNLAIARRNPRRFAQPKVIAVRAMVPSDLQYLRERSYRTRIRKLSESHHNMARLLAAGLTNREVAARLGYTESRICVLKADPSVAELIRSYQADIHASWREHVDSMHEMAVHNMIAAERMIGEKLETAEETGELPPMRDLLSITADRMDRFGYGKHNTSTNINVGFAGKLEAAISKAKQVTLSRKVPTDE